MKTDNFKTTTNRRVYRNDRIQRLQLTGCPRCAPHRGCNRHYQKLRSWKDITKKRKQWF